MLADLVGPVRAVLLDVDGPLCHVFGARAAARVAAELRGLVAGRGIEPPPDSADASPLDVLRAVVRTAPHLAGEVEAALRSAELEAAPRAETTLGAFALVGACHSTGRPLAIAADTATEAIHAYLGRRDRARYFTAVLGRDDADPALLAPNPDRVRRAVTALGADPASCLYVAGSPATLEAARRAGVVAVGYAARPHAAEPLIAAGARAVVDALDELAHAVHATGAGRDRLPWIDTTGGPLVALAEPALPHWHGTGPAFAANSGSDDWGDYGRACAVTGYAGLIPVAGHEALVLADEPTRTTYLAEHRAFVRWICAPSEAELIRRVPEAIRSARWEPVGEWAIAGPVELFDSALPGTDRHAAPRLRVELAPGRYQVRVARAEAGNDTVVVVTQLIAAASPEA